MNVIAVAQLLAERYQQYVTFLRALHAIIIRVHKASQELKESPQFRLTRHDLQTTAQVLFVPYTYNMTLMFHPLELKVDHLLLQGYLDTASPIIHGFAKLLLSTTFAAVPCTSYQSDLALADEEET
eukprot:4602679-Karenia_brevis.AAC.1